MQAGSYVELTGRLVDSPKEKQIGQKTVKEFSVAVDYSSGVNFFDVTIWGEEAEAFHGRAGQWVQVEGTLRQERWQDKQTELNRSRVRINANFAQVIDLTPSKARETAIRDVAALLEVGSRVEATADLPESSVSRGDIGKVVRRSGRTVTVAFDSGARATLSLEDASTFALRKPEQVLGHEPGVGH